MYSNISMAASSRVASVRACAHSLLTIVNPDNDPSVIFSTTKKMPVFFLWKPATPFRKPLFLRGLAVLFPILVSKLLESHPIVRVASLRNNPELPIRVVIRKRL